MKKIIVFAVALIIALAPLGHANYICDNVDSDDYLTATTAKLGRGLGNVALSWVELFRQPAINDNRWEGVGRGVVFTGVRAVAGALEAATSFIPPAEIPQPDPACPTDLLQSN